MADQLKNVVDGTAQSMIQKGSGLQVVVGLGQSGLSAVNYLLEQGYAVAVTDGNPNPSLASALPEAVQIRQFGAIDGDLLVLASRVVISPGVSLELPAVARALALGIPVVSDVQLFCEAFSAPIVAITGSNAKSTVTTLVGEMAKEAGVKVGVGGNIGIPALTLLKSPLDLAVLELSSFQLETISQLNAKVAVVLNMLPDHLDRHGDMLNYHRAKHRIFQGVQSVVINRDDALSRPLVGDAIAKISFGENAPDLNQYGLIQSGGEIFLARGSQRLLNANELKIKGKHNLLNALAALALGELAGLPLPSMLATLKRFEGLPHRCQFITQIDGVDYFNDSKGTNIGSTIAAISGLGAVYAQNQDQSTDQQNCIVLILGGQGKGQDFSELCPITNQFVSHVLLIGEDAQNIENALKKADLKDTIILKHCQDFNGVFATLPDLLSQAKPNVKAVLLSPACASFDQFSGYTDRGDQFIQRVLAMQNQ